MSRNTVARIDLSALRHNLAVVRALAPASQVASVVKADAYGHGIARIARALEGSDLLAVATADELRAVRTAGWGGRLLLLEGFTGAAEFETVLATDAETVIHHAAQLELLQQRGGANGQRLWLKLDTGMHRLGFPPEDAAELLQRLSALSHAGPPVLMSHFACADALSHPLNRVQLQRFQVATDGLPGQRSLANSAAVLNFPQAHADLIRPGIMLYGISPLPGKTGADHGLRPVMTLSCRLLAINDCRAGESVGYGATWQCPKDMRIGVAGIGYGDGYPRGVENGTPVLLNGRRAPLAGRVSMDLLTIDLRGHDDARVGDEVVLWGEGLPVEEIAAHCHAIPYELSCGVTRRVKRRNV
jgi:alanine racemase